MHFTSWQQVLQMDGHGIYVWPAYVIGIAVLVIFFLVLRARSRYLLRQLQRQLEQSQPLQPFEQDKQPNRGG
jgi:heme exporter protein D